METTFNNSANGSHDAADTLIQPPITTQPQAKGSSNTLSCPPGLEYLSQLNQLQVYQELVDLQKFVGMYQTQTRFSICDGNGQRVYYSQEESNCCMRVCCGADRTFQMNVMDSAGNKVVSMYRPLACMYCCCPCCLMTMEVTTSPGIPIGLIEQKWSFLAPKFVIKNPSGEIMLRIEGPSNFRKCCSCNDIVFKVLSADGMSEIGGIVSDWQGCSKSCGNQVDDFVITFPIDLDVRMKATLLGACFMVNMMYFENQFRTKVRE